MAQWPLLRTLVHELTTKINQKLENVDNWLKYNKLSLKYNKTQFMLFTENIRTQTSVFKLTTICFQELNVSSTLES